MRRVRAFVRRLVRWWRAADTATRDAGRAWYRTARRTAKRLARAHGCTLQTAAGVIAVLSPRLQWARNVTAAAEVLEGRSRVPGVFRASLAKARRIAAGERPEDVLSGPKVRAFYAALLGDLDAAVVDVWIARAAGIEDAPTDREYAQVAEALRMGAREVGEPTAVFQATTWVAIRGRA